MESNHQIGGSDLFINRYHREIRLTSLKDARRASLSHSKLTSKKREAVNGGIEIARSARNVLNLEDKVLRGLHRIHLHLTVKQTLSKRLSGKRARLNDLRNITNLNIGNQEVRGDGCRNNNTL